MQMDALYRRFCLDILMKYFIILFNNTMSVMLQIAKLMA